MRNYTAPKSAANALPDLPSSAGASILALVEKLYPFAYSVNGPGNDASIPAYLEELNFKVHEYKQGQDINGWAIPKSEIVTKAEIRKDGKLVYDGTVSPLGTILMCAPFKGPVSLEDLKPHLFYHSVNPDAIPFHCTQQYRPGKKDWGFCVPRTLYDSLQDGEYDIEINVTQKPTTMKVLDFILPGTSDETIVFQAHSCHPFQANDDISGCAIGIRLFQNLASLKHRRYTYRLLICPELTGTLFWLHKTVKKPERIKAAIILASVGNAADLKLQESFTGKAFIDTAAHSVFKNRYGTYTSGKFRTIHGNDETVFEAPGFAIPTISITRYPFPEYHTNLDTPDAMSADCLADTLEALVDLTAFIEQDEIYEFAGQGLYCLSHADYDLYKKVWDPSDRNSPKTREEGRSWNLLMTDLPRRMDGQTSIHALAADYGLPYNEVHAYCMKWVESGLLKRKK